MSAVFPSRFAGRNAREMNGNEMCRLCIYWRGGISFYR